MTSSEFQDKIVSLSPRIYPMVARMLRNEADAQDAVQEIMYRLWKTRRKLKNHPNYSGYVFLTARNYCLDQLKGRKSLESFDNNTDYNLMICRDEMENKEAAGLVKRIIDELPEKQRTIVVFRDIDGLEFGEIEAITGEKVANLRVLLSRSRKIIVKRITEIYEYEYEPGRKAI